MTTQLEPPPAQRVACSDCIHLREYPYGSGTVWKRRTGCFHPELMESKQKDDYLAEQQVPGDPLKLNLRGDCEKFEARPPRGSFLQRLLAALLS
jgi:hypothetical protein